jgi:predicted small metal-binding protein
MTFRLACGDVMPGCAARFENDDQDALLGEVADHAARDHDVAVITPEVRQAVLDRVVVS